MKVKKKEEINDNRKDDLSKIILNELLLKKDYIDNSVKYALNGKEASVNKKNKKNNLNVNQIDNDEIDTQLQNLVKHLYSLKLKLEKKKDQEKVKRQIIANDKDQEREKNAIVKNLAILNKEVHEIPMRNSSSKKIVPHRTQRDAFIDNHMPEIIKTIEIYKNKNLEEKKNKKYIIEKYESMLRNTKKQHIIEIDEIKNNILEDVDFLIQKYRKIALDLLEFSKKKEKEKTEEKKKIIEICINACKQFEENVKSKSKSSIQEYKVYMLKAINDAKKEKETLEKKIIELKKSIEEEKHKTEKEVFDIYEYKLKEQHELNKKLKSRLTQENEEQNIIVDIYSKVDNQIKIYEENIIKIFHNILIKNNVNMSISELCNCIKDAMDEQYKNSHS